MITSARLKLINFTDERAKAMVAGEAEFTNLLGINLPGDWTEEREAIETFYNEIKNDLANIKWGGYLIIHAEDNKLIGCCGFKGKPAEEGSVEIGYEIHVDYRGKGFAKEAAKSLTEFAFTFPDVNKVLAHTLAEENASCSILRKNGFSFVKQYTHPEDGEVWQWEIRK